MPSAKHRTDWFRDSRWGVFTHYLTVPETTAEDWNRQVATFDVSGLAQQLEAVGTEYYFITLGQNSGHYCSPNATYDSFVGITPSKCSERDLVRDLYDATHPKGVKLMVYLPSGAPAADPIAMARLGWEWGYEGGWPGAWNTKRTGKRLAEFQLKWEAVIREWSLRWGSKVHGWWFDGCYFAQEMYEHPAPPNFASFAAATRAGNPDSLVAFNPGVLYPVITMTEHEDYTAGEVNDPEKVDCVGRWVNQAQFHILSYLGPTWGAMPPRFSEQYVIAQTKRIIENEGVVTWDVPVEKSGLIPQPMVDQLTALRKALG